MGIGLYELHAQKKFQEQREKILGDLVKKKITFIFEIFEKFREKKSKIENFKKQ